MVRRLCTEAVYSQGSDAVRVADVTAGLGFQVLHLVGGALACTRGSRLKVKGRIREGQHEHELDEA